MPGIGTIVNVAAILAGSILGAYFGSLVSNRMRQVLTQVLGLVVIVVGLMGAIGGIQRLSELDGWAGHYAFLIVLVTLLVGTIIGELLKLEDQVKKSGEMLGRWLRKAPFLAKLVPAQSKEELGHDAMEGFISATLIFSIGAMTILGAIQDGLGIPNTLFLKAGLDGTTSLFLASSFGISVAFSAFPVLVVQGAIMLLSLSLGDVIAPQAIIPIEAVGGVVIAAIGLDILEIKRIPIASMLPAILIAIAVGFFV